MNEEFFRFINILNSLTVYKNIKQDELIKNILELLKILCFEESCYNNFLKVKELYSQICDIIWHHPSGNFSDYIYDLILYDDNLISRNVEMRAEVVDCAVKEFNLLLEVALMLKSELITNYIYANYRNLISDVGLLPYYASREGFDTSYEDVMRFYHQNGYGQFAKYRAFIFDRKCTLKPIVNVDNIQFDMLKLYSREKELIYNNTEAFIADKPYHNVLLYGDRGCGKSSVVKAIANHFASRGLRIVQINKDNLMNFGCLIDLLSANSLKFIIFIDDLSFNEDDDDFNALKAALEGALQKLPENIAIYATSNRCHLVKEHFSAREGDEIHLSDTINEVCSLSDRFGLIINYSCPKKEDYLEIVRQLAEDEHISTDEETLFKNAETFALEKGGRSPRIAKQYITELSYKNLPC